jgi:hypothetical protein
LEKVRLRFETGHPLFYARVEITTTDGNRYVDEADSYQPPPTDWADWLAEGGRSILPERRLARLAELIGTLEDVPDVSEVMACVVPGDAS